MSKRIILPAVAALSVLVTAGCSSSTSGGTSSGTSPATSTVAGASSTTGDTNSAAGGTQTFADMATVSNAFTTCVQKNYASPVKAAGFEPFKLYNNFTPSTAQTNLDTAITRKPAVALYTSFNAQYDTTSVNRLEAAGIKVVVLLGDTPSGTKPQGVLNANPPQYTKATLDELHKLKPSITKIGLIAGQQGSAASDQASAAIVASAKAVGIDVVQTLWSNYSASGGATAAQNMLQAHPDIQAIIGYGDDGALAAARVVKSSGHDIPVIDVYSFSTAALNSVRDGDLLFAAWMPEATWGQTIATSIRNAARGTTTPEQYLPLTIVDQANAASTPSNGC